MRICEIGLDSCERVAVVDVESTWRAKLFLDKVKELYQARDAEPSRVKSVS